MGEKKSKRSYSTLKYLYFNFKDVFNDYDEKEKREEKNLFI